MSEKNNNKFGEIGTIRDILMGQQMDEYEERFNEIKKMMAALEKDLTQALNNQNNKLSEILEKLDKESSARFETLEKTIDKKIHIIYEKMASQHQADQKKLGKIFSKIGEQLLGNDK